MMEDYQNRANNSLEDKKMEKREKEQAKAIYQQIEKNLIDKKLGIMNYNSINNNFYQEAGRTNYYGNEANTMPIK